MRFMGTSWCIGAALLVGASLPVARVSAATDTSADQLVQRDGGNPAGFPNWDGPRRHHGRPGDAKPDEGKKDGERDQNP